MCPATTWHDMVDVSRRKYANQNKVSDAYYWFLRNISVRGEVCTYLSVHALCIPFAVSTCARTIAIIEGGGTPLHYSYLGLSDG